MTSRQLHALTYTQRLELAREVELPYSEVCMHMRVAGKIFPVVPLDGGMAQILHPDGRIFSAPITNGEAGLRSDDHAVQFGTLEPSGAITNARSIKQSDIMACPQVILMADHYRADGSCRCDDPEHREMAEWGYTWNADEGRWT